MRTASKYRRLVLTAMVLIVAAMFGFACKGGEDNADATMTDTSGTAASAMSDTSGNTSGTTAGTATGGYDTSGTGVPTGTGGMTGTDITGTASTTGTPTSATGT